MIARVILVSLRNLARQPVRTLLILQGVIWGTALGVVPSAIINGTMQYASDQAGELGTDRLLVAQENIDVVQHFDWPLAARLRRAYEGRIRHVAGLALTGETPEGVSILGTQSDALGAQRLKIRHGRFFTEEEVRSSAPVCVLQHNAAQQLFGDENPVGRSVSLGTDISAEVVGVTAERFTAQQALDNFGYSEDHALGELVDDIKRYIGAFDDGASRVLADDSAVLAPWTLFSGAVPRWVEVRAEPADVVSLRDDLQGLLTGDGYEPVIYINAILPALYGETLSTFMELNRTIFVLCICVGTSIVCVIMVLSVVERQREIAIRRVEGARKWHIALQFVVETGTLCTVGGLLGVPLGVLLAIVRCAIEPLAAVTWAFPTAEAAVIVAVVSIIGLLGGLLPAWRAMSVDPVEMLRYE